MKCVEVFDRWHNIFKGTWASEPHKNHEVRFDAFYSPCQVQVNRISTDHYIDRMTPMSKVPLAATY